MTVDRPFLLLSTRPEDAAANEERLSFQTKMRIPEDAIEQRRVEQGPLGDVDLDTYSGVLLGGSPFNHTEPSKSELQLRIEREIGTLVNEIIDRDFPLMGACYGIGTVGSAIGARLGDEHAEEAGMVELLLTDDAVDDPLLEGFPKSFPTLVGHKEAISELPESATLLLTGIECPTQMFRVKTNVYATQFHPELTAETLEARLRLYAHLGYFRLDVFDDILETAYAHDYSYSNRILANFAERYRRF
ncbi:glutamine amidotransferase [Corynebacterium glaucum]|uniref:glutamine amidotransferase n=1 Tax=Corynebacterium glaucum TaxID=187491 RepID=UPI0025B57DA6|nr:glutamine amidotransferase [Corynebacterium glaucum]WJZ07778.1 glutamine amidotransferase [Corynebacterium glaucum]